MRLGTGLAIVGIWIGVGLTGSSGAAGVQESATLAMIATIAVAFFDFLSR